MVTVKRQACERPAGQSRALLSKMTLCAGATIENQLPMVLSVSLRNRSATARPVRANINPGRRLGITTILPIEGLEIAVAVTP